MTTTIDCVVRECREKVEERTVIHFCPTAPLIAFGKIVLLKMESRNDELQEEEKMMGILSSISYLYF